MLKGGRCMVTKELFGGGWPVFLAAPVLLSDIWYPCSSGNGYLGTIWLGAGLVCYDSLGYAIEMLIFSICGQSGTVGSNIWRRGEYRVCVCMWRFRPDRKQKTRLFGDGWNSRIEWQSWVGQWHVKNAESWLAPLVPGVFRLRRFWIIRDRCGEFSSSLLLPPTSLVPPFYFFSPRTTIGKCQIAHFYPSNWPVGTCTTLHLSLVKMSR